MIQDMKILSNIFEVLPSGVLIYNNQGAISQINSRAKELLRLPASGDYAHLESFPGYLSELVQRLDVAGGDISRSEIKIQFPEQETPSVIGFTLKYVRLETGEPSEGEENSADSRIFIFNEITHIVQERLAMDKIKDELFQSKKLASIGTMISGVAHELNNPLTGISMSTQLSEMTLRSLIKTLDPKTDADTIRSLESALQELRKSGEEARKAAVLVSDLLNYSKPSQLNLSLENPVKLTGEMVQTIQSHPEFSQIRFHIEPYETQTDILCDRVKVEQVFYNLFKNASDAMENEGDIHIRFSDTRNLSDNTPMIQISVSDAGPGMDKTLLSRIFDPFFTTKGAKGVGLGLSISFRTIEQHGGTLTVESPKEQGACFHISLPLFVEEEEAIIF